jgi:hypothetical protein
MGTVCCLSCMGQQVVILSNEVNIRLPKTIKKLNKNEVSSFAKKKFNNDKIALNTVEEINPDHTYTVDNVLISLFYGNKSVKEGYLLELKRGLDEMSKRDKSYTSSIKTINNNKVLVINETSGNVGYYRFFCYNKTNSSGLNGVLQFNKTDEGSALGLLNDILEGVTFTK